MRLTALFRTRAFHAAALLATLAVAALNGCHFENSDGRMPRVETYGAQNVACSEWTDGCQICRRSAGSAAPACSLPGIACTRGPITCKATGP